LLEIQPKKPEPVEMTLPDARHIKRVMQWAETRLPPPAPKPGRCSTSDYPDVIREVARKFQLETRIEANSYGQGYASFVEAWFYKDTQDFRLAPHTEHERHFLGLYVLFCRRAPYFAMGSGAKSWRAGGGSSFMPSFQSTDVFAIPAIAALATKVAALGAARGLVRLQKSDLAEPLPQDLRFDSNLSDGPPRLFDALFFWND
jgi:hypothetical protein